MSTSDQHIFDMCALCGDGGDHQRTIELYCCVNAPCPFSFCMNCIKKLLTAEQVSFDVILRLVIVSWVRWCR